MSLKTCGDGAVNLNQAGVSGLHSELMKKFDLPSKCKFLHRIWYGKKQCTYVAMETDLSITRKWRTMYPPLESTYQFLFCVLHYILKILGATQNWKLLEEIHMLKSDTEYSAEPFIALSTVNSRNSKTRNSVNSRISAIKRCHQSLLFTE